MNVCLRLALVGAFLFTTIAALKGERSDFLELVMITQALFFAIYYFSAEMDKLEKEEQQLELMTERLALIDAMGRVQEEDMDREPYDQEKDTRFKK